MHRLSLTFELLLLLLLGAFGLSAPVASAQTPATVRLEVEEVGFAGTYKVGHWTPVRLSLEADREVQGRLELVAPDSDGVDVRFVRQEPVTLAPNQKLVVWHYAKFGRLRGGLTARLMTLDETTSLAEATVSRREMPDALAATRPLVVSVGGSIGVEEAAQLRRRNLPNLASVVVPEYRQLPDQWHGFEGVDLLVLTLSQSEPLQSASPSQLAAVEQWVRLGGRVLLSVGAEGAAGLSESGSLSALAPGRVSGVIEQPRSAGLEVYAEANEPIDGVRGPDGQSVPLAVTVLEEPQGQVELWEQGGAARRPLIVHAHHGFGSITFVAVGLDELPLAQWAGRPSLVAKLLQLTFAATADDELRAGRVTHVGYEDLAGQLRSALDQFKSVRFIPFSIVAALLVAYILLIGPGDYVLLRRIRRMHWGWVTFPIAVLVFASLAYSLTIASKGQRVWINQVDLVDVDLEQSLVRGTMWANLYSPQSETYDLKLLPKSVAAAESPEVLLSWQGLPGKGLGGLGTSTSTAGWERTYSIVSSPPSRAGAIEGLPVQVSATRSVTGRWWSTLSGEVEHIELQADADGLLQGTLINPLPVDLADCRLYYRQWAYLFQEEFAAGGSIPIDLLTPRILDWHLTRHRLVEGAETTMTPWDPLSFHVPRIMEIMMFHGAAGGERYTELSHRFQSYVDLSKQLELGNAVLVGRVKEPGSRLSTDSGEMADHYENHWTFYRVVIPVQPSS